ncbi:hypothetical protein GCM10011507_09280 [Edaphobacter acidisoli]|uniref:Thioredoxin domain-containing protein n=1 Tax=Edaphobacter acidisoli TaxID=2040573 RepID=A0A916W239_9BACT|nr:redoxin domain-containing protein [Edaphobacter acidisoli]GGA59885.1 hypothetical protein GCM10011507_09280 [Edaphobacter acidisoli]
MKKFLLAAILLVTSVPTICQESQSYHLGGQVMGFTVLNMKGHAVNYRNFKGKVTVVMFFSTRCPLSNAFNFRRNMLYREYKDRVQFIVVDSNGNESLAEVKQYAKDVGFAFPVYVDQKNAVSDRFGVLATTDNFLLDASGVMRYHGYIEDAPNPARTTKQGLKLAIDEVLAGKAVTMPETMARGCSVRRAKLKIHYIK